MRTSHIRRTRHIHARSAQDTGPNLVLGPGGQTSIVAPINNAPLPPPNIQPSPQLVNPQQAQPPSPATSTSLALGTGSTSLSSASQSPQQILVTSLSPIVSQLDSSVTSSLLPATSLSAFPPVSTSVLDSTVTVSSTLALPTPSSSILSTFALSTNSATATSTATSASTASSTSTSVPASVVSGHGPEFYVAIVLGVIAAIACLAALIAWAVRLRSHLRRQPAFVPWGDSVSDDDLSGVEQGRDRRFDGQLINQREIVNDDSTSSMHRPSLFSLGVGEPKRTDSYLNSPISLAKPSSNFVTASNMGSVPPLPDSIAYPLPGSRNPRPLPSPFKNAEFNTPGSSYQSVDEHQHSACTLGPLQIANMMPGDASAASSRAGTALGMSGGALSHDGTPVNLGVEFGTPRESVPGLRPRFLGVDGEGLRVPWSNPGAACPDRRPSLASRLKLGSGGWGNKGTNWEHLPPLPMPGETTERAAVNANDNDAEGWTASIKSNLVNAFNAVAANLPASSSLSGGLEKRDNLTPIRPRRSTRRGESRQASGWQEFSSGDSVGKTRSLSRTGTTNSRASSAWTLEETKDGAGVVHIRNIYMGLEGYGGGDHAFAPQASQASSIGGEMGANISRAWTHESQAPLIGHSTKKPKAAFIRPDMAHRRSHLSRFGRSEAGGLRVEPSAGTVSRASSVYSTASARSSIRENGSVLPRMSDISALRTNDVVVRRNASHN